MVGPAIIEQEAEEYPGKGKIYILVDLQFLFTMAIISHEQIKKSEYILIIPFVYFTLIYFELINQLSKRDV